jgi:hypothetical protein
VSSRRGKKAIEQLTAPSLNHGPHILRGRRLSHGTLRKPHSLRRIKDAAKEALNVTVRLTRRRKRTIGHFTGSNSQRTKRGVTQPMKNKTTG